MEPGSLGPQQPTLNPALDLKHHLRDNGHEIVYVTLNSHSRSFKVINLGTKCKALNILTMSLPQWRSQNFPQG